MTVRESQIDDLVKQVEVLQAQHEVDTATIANLRTALDTARQIGAAIGVLMATRSLDEREAFELLQAASNQSQRKVRDIAAEIVASTCFSMDFSTNLMPAVPPDHDSRTAGTR